MTDEGAPDQLDPFKLADKAIAEPKAQWWASLDDNKQVAWMLLLSAGAVGALGVPLFSAIADAGKVPSTKNFIASFWLLVITLPVAGIVATFVYNGTSPPKLQGATLLWVCVGAAVAGFALMNVVIEAAGGSLSGFYCYNNGGVHETACRALRDHGLATSQLGSPGQNSAFLANVFVVIADARGSVMATCGAIAGGATGYLLRRQADGT